MINPIIYAVIFTLFLSYTLGKIISVKLNLNDKLPICAPLGLFAIFGLYELLTFPIMVWHLSSEVLTLLTLLMTVIITGYSLFHFKLWWKIKINLDLIVVSVFAVFLIVFYYNVDNLSYTAEDFNFYIPFVSSNAKALSVNMIDPWSGEGAPLNWIYNFQGYYLMLSALSNLLSMDPLLVTLWFPSLLFLIMMPMCLMNVVTYFFKDTNRWLKYCLFIALFCLMNDTLSGIIYPFYGNQFRPLIMIYLIFVYTASKEGKSYWQLGLLALLMFSHFSVQSTGLFVGMMLVVLLLIYEVFFNQEPNLIKPLVTSMPLALYGVGIISTFSLGVAGVLLLLLIIVYGILCYTSSKYPSILQSIFKVFSLILLCVLVLGSLVLTVLQIESPVSMVSFIPSLFDSITYIKANEWINFATPLMILKSGYVLITWLLIVGLAFYKSEDKEYKLYKVIALGTLILFYNPLVAPVVSKYLTGVVYGRTTILMFSLITFALGLKYVIELVKSPRFKVLTIIGLTGLTGFLFISNSVIHAQDFKLKWITPDPRNDVFYKLPYDLIEAHKGLTEYKLEYYQDPTYRPVVLSCDLRTRLINENLKLVFNVINLRDFYAVYEENPYDYKMFLYSIITDSDRFAEHDKGVFEDFERRLRAYTVEFLIVPTDGNIMLYDTLNSFATRVYINDSYMVYHMSYLY
ncbi:MAG: DUF6077 domain-containing protein [Turicibacter sp.]